MGKGWVWTLAIVLYQVILTAEEPEVKLLVEQVLQPPMGSRPTNGYEKRLPLDVGQDFILLADFQSACLGAVQAPQRPIRIGLQDEILPHNRGVFDRADDRAILLPS